MGGLPRLLEEHFLYPRNTGALEGAATVIRAENPVCGDLLVLHADWAADGSLRAVKFQAYGCPAAVGVGSFLTEALHGLQPGEMGRWDPGAISAALGGLDDGARHAAILGGDAVAALARARARGGPGR